MIAPCDESSQECVNTNGSYTCLCLDGFLNSTQGCIGKNLEYLLSLFSSVVSKLFSHENLDLG